MTEASKKVPTPAELMEELKLPMSLSVRNLARDPSSRTARKLRPGNYTGFLLSDGRRVRRAGVRATELSTKDLLIHIDQVVEGVELREIEVYDKEVMVPLEALRGLAQFMKGERPFDEDKTPVPTPETPAPEEKTQVFASEAPVQEPSGGRPDWADRDPATSEVPPAMEPPAPTEPAAKLEWTPAELSEMKRGDLNKLASSEFGVKNPERFKTQKQLIDEMLKKKE